MCLYKELVFYRLRPTYTYDNNGNVTAIGSLDYTWDWRNRLSSAERGGGGITSYGYDHTGQRVPHHSTFSVGHGVEEDVNKAAGQEAERPRGTELLTGGRKNGLVARSLFHRAS